MTIDVVMPVLNEEARIASQLDHLSSLAGIGRVLVVDGGSHDRTAEIVAGHGRAELLHSDRGRAVQMNAGAAQSRADVLVFVHADVALPADAAEWIERALSDDQVVAGAFRTWTVCDGQGRQLGPLSHLADIRSRYSRLPYGDQALFVRAEVFGRIGGFPPQPLMEDLELSRRLRKVGRIRTVPARVRVSGRRFQARPLYYTALINVFPLLYRLGLSPQLLARLYGNPR